MEFDDFHLEKGSSQCQILASTGLFIRFPLGSGAPCPPSERERDNRLRALGDRKGS